MVPSILDAASKHRQTHSPNLSHVSGLTSPTNPWNADLNLTWHHAIGQHLKAAKAAHRRTSGIQSSADASSLPAVSQSRSVEWRNRACARQQTEISPFWSAGRQQRSEGRRSDGIPGSPLRLSRQTPPKLRLHARHLRGPVIKTVPTGSTPDTSYGSQHHHHASSAAETLHDDKPSTFKSIYLTLPELDWQKIQDRTATKFLHVTTHDTGEVPGGFI